MEKFSQYRSPKNKQVSTVEDDNYKPSPVERSYSEYRSPKSNKPTVTNKPAVNNNTNDVSNTEQVKKYISGEVKGMQNSIKSLVDSFSNKNSLLNSFLSSYTTTKTNLEKSLSGIYENLVVDNKWGQQTQKSLVHVLELAAALINVNENLKLNSNEFSLSDFNKLKENLLGFSIGSNNLVTLPYNEQIKRSGDIKKSINSLIMFYNDIVDKLSNNKMFSFVDKVVDTGKKLADKIELSNYDHTLINNVSGFFVKIKTFKGDIDVPLLSLKDKDSYLSWAQNQLKLNAEDAKLFFSRYIKPQINTAPINSNV